MTNQLQNILQAAATALVNGLWQGAALIVVVLLALRLVERRELVSAATGYSVRMLTLVAVLAMHVAALASALRPSSSDFAPALDRGAGSLAAAAGSDALFAHGRVPVADIPSAGSFDPGPASGVSQGSTIPEAPGESPALSAPPTSTRATERSPLRATSWLQSRTAGALGSLLVVVWILGSLVLLARLAVATTRVRRIKRTGRVVTLEPELGSGRNARVIESGSIGTPVAAGYLRPAVLLPSGLERSLSATEFREVLLHETAHLRRFDDFTLLFQRVAEALLFLNPAVRILADDLECRREMACDEWVVARTGNGPRYARSLARLLEIRLSARYFLVAPGMPGNHLRERLGRLLRARSPEAFRHRGDQVAVAAVVIALVGTFMAWKLPGVHLPAWSVWTASGQPVERPSEPTAPAPAVAPALAQALAPAVAPAPAPAPAVAWPDAAPEIATSESPTVPLPESVPRAIEDLSVQSWIRIIEAAGRISSSGEAARVLILAAERMPDDARVTAAYIAATTRISSSGERSRALARVADRAARTEATLRAYTDTARGISSSGERARALRAMERQ